MIRSQAANAPSARRRPGLSIRSAAKKAENAAPISQRGSKFYERCELVRGSVDKAAPPIQPCGPAVP